MRRQYFMNAYLYVLQVHIGQHFYRVRHMFGFPLCFPKFSINTKKYILYRETILKDVVKPWSQTQFGDKRWTFQQHSAPAHRAKASVEWCRENRVAYIAYWVIRLFVDIKLPFRQLVKSTQTYIVSPDTFPAILFAS